MTVADLTLAFSDLTPRSEPAHFGSPNRPGLAIVRPVAQAPTLEQSKCLQLFSTYLQRERRSSEHTVVHYLNDVRQFENWLELNGRGEAGNCLEQATRDSVQGEGSACVSSAPVAACLCYAHARPRSTTASSCYDARTREAFDYADLHASLNGQNAGSLPQSTSPRRKHTIKRLTRKSPSIRSHPNQWAFRSETQAQYAASPSKGATPVKVPTSDLNEEC